MVYRLAGERHVAARTTAPTAAMLMALAAAFLLSWFLGSLPARAPATK
jgi:hypothetical protein